MNNHNKKRNTAFLFQVLTKEIAKRSYENKDRQKVVNVLKEYFKKGTELQKDLKCYMDILDTHGVSSRQADKVLEEVKRYRSVRVDEKKLFNEQTKLLSEMHNNISSEIFDHFVPSFREMASVYQIFNNKSAEGRDKVVLEESVVAFMTRPKKKLNEAKVETLDEIEYNAYIQRFNEFYGQSLYEEQKALLENYIFSDIDAGASLKVFLNDELKRLKKRVVESLDMKEVTEDDSMVEKTEEVLDFLEEMKTKELDVEMLQNILKIQNLVREYDNGD